MIEWGQKSNPPPTLLIYFFPTIVTASKAAPGIHQIKGQFDKVTKIHPSSRAHTTRSAKDDEMLMLKDLWKLRPFHITANRCHEHFQEITLSPLVGQDIEKFFFLP